MKRNTRIPGGDSAGTSRIIIEEFSSTPFQERLIKKIQKYHSIHIQKRVNIILNNNKVIPYDFTILDDGKNFKALRESKTIDNVSIEIIAGYNREEKLFGWCVFCNDRIVLINDVSYRTGFNKVNFHFGTDKSFLGLIFFNSSDPSKLPWKSGKDDIAPENPIYRAIQYRMNDITEELIEGLTRKIYRAKDSEGTTIGVSIYEGIETKSWLDIPKGQKPKYPSVKILDEGEEETESTPFTAICYSVEKEKIKVVKKHMGNPSMKNKQVGLKTFDYYCNLEGLKDEK